MATKMRENMENEAPFLFISHGDFMEKQLIYNLLENDFDVLNIPMLCDMRVMASSYGWLVLSNTTTTHCCLLNPTSMEIVKLPNLEIACVYNICVLSKPPTEPDCHILFNSASTVEQSFCRVGDEEFVHVKEKDEDGNIIRRLRAVGSFKGKIYGIIEPQYTIVTIHFVGKTLEFRPIMKVDDGDKPWCIPQLSRQVSRPYEYMWLIESPQSACRGKVELLLVKKIFLCNYITDGLDFKVFHIDTDQMMTCVELDDIGQRAIFLSHHGGAIFLSHHGGGFCCCSSTTKIRPNSIYYTDHYGRYLYIYELGDSSTTSLLPSDLADCNSVSSWIEHQIFPQNFHQ